MYDFSIIFHDMQLLQFYLHTMHIENDQQIPVSESTAQQ